MDYLGEEGAEELEARVNAAGSLIQQVN